MGWTGLSLRANSVEKCACGAKRSLRGSVVVTKRTRNALVGEFMVGFLLVFIVLRTAVNSDFFIRRWHALQQHDCVRWCHHLCQAPRFFFRFHMVRTETCLTLLCRVHRYLLKSAITVCLMGHTAVQTSVAQRVCFHLSRATQSATLSSASICRRMMCCQVERMTKDMTASVPSTLKIIVVAPTEGNIITVGAKRFCSLHRYRHLQCDRVYCCLCDRVKRLGQE